MEVKVDVDVKDLIIEDMARTLKALERTLRSAGSIEFQCYHNARDRELAGQFLKMASACQASLDYRTQLQHFEGVAPQLPTPETPEEEGRRLAQENPNLGSNLWGSTRRSGDNFNSLADAYYAELCKLDATITQRQPELSVWYGAMPETNGKSNYTAILYRKDEGFLGGVSITLDRSEYPDRVRYEADRARFMIGELDEEPFILDYDANKLSGYKGDQ